MVKILKCHSFASQNVIPVSKEPLVVCADGDKVFIATSDCEIIVFHISNGTSTETQRCPTISQVENIVYNSFKNYIATIELKKSWKRSTKSVRVYLNWESCTPGATKPRTKVRVAGKSHVQHVSSSSKTELMEIVEVPLEEDATSVAVCRYTGNFAISCGSEVKLCSIVEKTVANSDKTYLDVDVFLELCWNFPVQSISICEEFVVCCSQKEVHGIRVKYDDGENPGHKRYQTSASLTSQGFNHWDPSVLKYGRVARVASHNEYKSLESKLMYRLNSDMLSSTREFSAVGMCPNQRGGSQVSLEEPATVIVDDENFVEWNFQLPESSTDGATVCLPSLYAGSTQSQRYLHTHLVSPPVLSHSSGGKVKSITGVQAETVLYLSDPQEKDEFNSIILIPSYSSAQPSTMRTSNVSADRMRSALRAQRTSMCCYVSGVRGGYLYQISPLLAQVSSYKYTDQALQVGVSQNYLHVVTRTGIETYTSRWGAVSLEKQKLEEDEADIEQIHPPASLDVCLCGHEPFMGAVSLSVGAGFLTIMSKVEDLSSSEVHWSLYVLHTFSLVELYKDMIHFADKIKVTGPSSYIHLLQEAHLLLVTNPLFTVDPEVKECYHEVCGKLGEYYSQPWQEDWYLCWPYYTSSGIPVRDIVKMALEQAAQTTPQEFGGGLIDCLDNNLFDKNGCGDLPAETCDAILNVYAVSAPEKLSQVILLSNMKLFSPDSAFQHLKAYLSKKASTSHLISCVDKLAMVQLHLIRCEVDHACSQLSSIHKSNLVDLGSSYPSLIYDSSNTFTPLSQLMRQHMSATFLEILVEMLDRCVITLDSLLLLLKSQSDFPYNNHVKELLEIILSDEKRALLFDKTAELLCEIYIARLKENSQPSPKQMAAVAHHKFSLPQGNGHFAPRFAWLDYLPPFQGPNKMAKQCQRLEVKQITGQGSRGASMPVNMVTRHVPRERCQCFVCNENLLKLQSLLCSKRLTPELALFVLHQVDNAQSEVHDKVKDISEECWDSVRLLCLANLDLEKAVELMVDRHAAIIGMFAASCFTGSMDKYGHLLRRLEMAIKSSSVSSSLQGEEVYVKAYKDLLSRMTELFHPATFLELLPADGNLYFILPYLCTCIKLDHTDKLKQKIVKMGMDLVSHN